MRRAPTATEAAFARGFAAMRRGDHGEAAAQMEIAIASGPDEPLAADARYWRGVALARAGRGAMAREAMAEFLDRHPSSPRAGQASVMLGWLLLEAGDRTAAFRRFQAAQRDHDPAVRDSAAKGLGAIRAGSPD